MGFLILDGKKPIHKFKDTDGKSWDEVKMFDNIGLIVPKPFIVYDFDNKIEAEIMLNIVKHFNIKTRVYKTTRGIHCWFRCDDKLKNTTHSRSAIGLIYDRKCHSANAYVKIKQDGQMREVILECEDDEIQEIPQWLRCVNVLSTNTDFVGNHNGDGRNQKLFNYIITLQKLGFKEKEIIEILNIINDFVFDEPLSDSEMNTIYRKEAFKSDEEIEEMVEDNKKKFNHVEIANKLMSKLSIICYHDFLYYKHDNLYTFNDLVLKRELNRIKVDIKESQRNEVLSYIKAEKVILDDEIPFDPYVLAIKDTKINVLTGELIPYNDNDIIFTRLDVTYNPDIECPAVDEVLNNVFLGDKELITLFYEMVGTCFIKESVREKAFILIGDGSNGKSTILMMLQYLLKGNYSTLGLDEIVKQFNTVALENKLANIGDDINNEILKETGKTKRIIAGNEVNAEYKGKQAYTIKPYCTHIYTGNSLPRSTDTSNGFYRRFMILPFDANFSESDNNFRPNIIHELRTEEAKSYLFKKGMEAIQKVYERGIRFTKSKRVEDMQEEYKEINNGVVSWIKDKSIEVEHMLITSRDDLYIEYANWCSNANIKAKGKIGFYKEVRKHFNLVDIQKKDRKRYFALKI